MPEVLRKVSSRVDAEDSDEMLLKAVSWPNATIDMVRYLLVN
jgi:hypothetical protein